LFPTTRRSVVLALTRGDAAGRRRAFEALVRIYWRPLYKYARLAHQRTAADAEDCTQSFLARALEKSSLATYDPEKASFRTFLRLLFDRHIANEVKAASRQKRGGGGMHLDFASAEEEISREEDHGASPDDYFHRQWVKSVFSAALDRLRESSEARDFRL